MIMAMMVVRMMGISTMIESGSVLIRLERSGEQEGSQTLGHSGALSLIINFNITFININIKININDSIINNIPIKDLLSQAPCLVFNHRLININIKTQSTSTLL